MVQNFLTKVFGSRQVRDLKKYRPYVDRINEEFARLESFSDEDLKGKTVEFRARLAEGETLDDLAFEAFAVVKEACRRLCGKTWDVAGQPVTWEMVPYDVQLMGGLVLHHGRIAEMATGEGKTLVAVLPLYLNALEGSSHLVTVNDYLALRDSQWMGKVFESLGLTVGVIQQGQSPAERRLAYEADITYGTNNEFGFDYLRDNMAVRKEDRVQRGYHFAIVDEVDSVLIDEARTPLIISGPVESDTHRFDELKAPVQRLFTKQRELVNQKVAEAEKLLKKDEEEKDEDARYEAGRLLLEVQRGMPKNRRFMKLLAETGVKKLIQQVEADFMRDKKMHEVDEELFYTIDERRHNCDLMERGRQFISPKSPEYFILPDLADELTKIEGDGSLSDEDKAQAREDLHSTYDDRAARLQNLSQLLRAYSLYEKDVNYVVQEGKVIIVDEFTGRMMPGRRFSDGLHQALEAKEGVKIERDNQTLATITLQNYFRMYQKLAGMTGTAETEESEFVQIYELDVVVIPTNRPVVRDDAEDHIYRTKREKFNAVIEEIQEMHRSGRPVLVGTTSVETSELISRMLKRVKIPHSVLNAKYHQKEAEIVAKAGLTGAVTIATNMAGRGTDIKLGEGVREAGGLHIIGTERHEARRIDRQLRGRAGRQGDPGSSRFYLSLEDDLMRLFQSDRVATVMDKLGVEEGEVIEHRFMTKAIERAQKRVEEQNFGIRKHLLEYDNVMNKQREIIYARRLASLEGEDLKEECRSLVADIAAATVEDHTIASGSDYADDWDFDELRHEFGRRLGVDLNFEDYLNEGQETGGNQGDCGGGGAGPLRGAGGGRGTGRLPAVRAVRDAHHHRLELARSPVRPGSSAGGHRTPGLRAEGPASRVQEGGLQSLRRPHGSDRPLDGRETHEDRDPDRGPGPRRPGRSGPPTFPGRGPEPPPRRSPPLAPDRPDPAPGPRCRPPRARRPRRRSAATIPAPAEAGRSTRSVTGGTRNRPSGAGWPGPRRLSSSRRVASPVDLWEMRPAVTTPAHRTDALAEIVCSNSFKSMSRTHASGLLKSEMKRLGCFLVPLAEECRVEAGTALAIDRERFSAAVTARVEAEPGIRVRREELREIPDGPVVVATGPLTSEALTAALLEFVGSERLSFYDATAPIVSAESIDRNVVFAANRRDAGEGHYLNCPFTEAEYDAFHQAVLEADRYPLHDFENASFFEACMPIDELARRGRQTLCFGPMRPVGLTDPRTGRRPFAVAQLRPENREATAYNLVGFQNRMRRGDQRKALRLVPGLEKAEFYRLGRVHRNTYLDAPKVLDGFLAVRKDPRVSLAGQLTGLEGYVECVATGMLAARFTTERLAGRSPRALPPETALGSILRFVTEYEGKDYRPTNVNFGLFPPLPHRLRRGKERNEAMVARAEEALSEWLAGEGVPAG